jgi:hypothetical protein
MTAQKSLLVNDYYLISIVIFKVREVVQTFHHPTVLPSGHKKSSGSGKTGKPFLLGHQATTGTTDMPGVEPVYIETSEKQQEEMVFTLNISKFKQFTCHSVCFPLSIYVTDWQITLWY